MTAPRPSCNKCTGKKLHPVYLLVFGSVLVKLRGFENRGDPPPLKHSLSYLFIQDSNCAKDAWNSLLCREPRALEWPELDRPIGLEQVMGFDISIKGATDGFPRLFFHPVYVRYSLCCVYFFCLLNLCMPSRLHIISVGMFSLYCTVLGVSSCAADVYPTHSLLNFNGLLI